MFAYALTCMYIYIYIYILKYMEICSAPSYGVALLLPMVLLCSFLWSCSAPSYGIACMEIMD